jgi:hypothetical protein
MKEAIMTAAAPARRLFSFIAGAAGPWAIESMQCLVGDPLPRAPRLLVVPEAAGAFTQATAWVLQGITSNERYVEREEKKALVGRQEGLGRAASSCAALIPIRKSAAWWSLSQDERRDIFEAQSRHIGIGLKYLPAIARRLHHCRDLGHDEAFDFITWFEYSPADVAAFDELLDALRRSPEWAYVDRELDLRLARADA